MAAPSRFVPPNRTQWRTADILLTSGLSNTGQVLCQFFHDLWLPQEVSNGRILYRKHYAPARSREGKGEFLFGDPSSVALVNMDNVFSISINQVEEGEVFNS